VIDGYAPLMMLWTGVGWYLILVGIAALVWLAQNRD